VQAAACREPPALGLLGEFCALGESFKFLAEPRATPRPRILGEAVEAATQGYLDNDNAPKRKPGQPDNRDSHYWFARYWAEALAAQTEDAALAAHFAPIAKALAEKEDQITAELMADRGKPVDQGGYYHPIRPRRRRDAALGDAERDHRRVITRPGGARHPDRRCQLAVRLRRVETVAMTYRALILVPLLIAAPALADRADQDLARRALEAGEILPLSEILAAAGAARPGHVIEVELERENGRWIYDLEVLSPEGLLYELEIDAASGSVLEIERGDEEEDGEDDD
jgi:uncharacterized membrane protein YkoI